MPLKRGSSKETFEKNVREMVKSGHKPKQAVAAAYDTQRRAAAKKGRK